MGQIRPIHRAHVATAVASCCGSSAWSRRSSWSSRRCGTRRLEDVLTAVWFVALLLPAGIAPNACYARLGQVGQTIRRCPRSLGCVLLLSCGSFVLLTDFIARTPSAVVAVRFALILTAVSVVRSRRRV